MLRQHRTKDKLLKRESSAIAKLEELHELRLFPLLDSIDDAALERAEANPGMDAAVIYDQERARRLPEMEHLFQDLAADLERMLA